MNYIIPLLTLPYLARVLAPEQFGILGFAGGVTSYVALVTDWGFSLSATRDVAFCRESGPFEVSKVFWNTLLAKAMLGICALSTLILLIYLVPALHNHGRVLLLCSIGLLGSVVTADWFFQGIERMGPFAAAATIGRVVPIPLIFLLVHKPGDVEMAAFLGSAGNMIAGALSLTMALRTDHIILVRPSVSGAFHAIRSGTSVFISIASTSLYSNANLIVLFTIAGPVQSGLFAGADKIRRAAQGLITPLSTVMYPRICNSVATNRKKAVSLILRLLVVQGTLTFVLSVATWLTAAVLVRMVLGADYSAATDVLRALAPVPFFIGLSNVLGIQTMLPFGLRREFMLTILLPGILSLSYMPLLAYSFGAVGVAWALSVTEFGVTILAAVLLNRSRHHIVKSPVNTLPAAGHSK